jgi:aspartate aminotransferase-like enzyme
MNRLIRRRLQDLGCTLIAPADLASPAVISFVPPAGIRGGSLGRRMARAGVLLSYQSAYLRQRNWMQICLMGDISTKHVEFMLAELDRALSSMGTARKMGVA